MLQQDNVMFFQKLLREPTNSAPISYQLMAENSEPVSDASSAISSLIQSGLSVLARQHFCTRSSGILIALMHAMNNTSCI
jgi:hypothetical protein